MTTIVSGLLEKSGSLIAEGAWPELKSFLCFQKEVRKLQSTLCAIQAVLEDADKRQVNEKAVKLWLDKLKEAAYDMDNVLDELETAIIKAQVEEEEEKAETTTATAKVWSSCTTCISWIFRVVTELVQRGFIVSKIKNLNETLDEIDKEKGRYNFVLGSITSTEVGERLETYSLVDVKEIHGRDERRDDLVRKILGEGSEVRELSGEGSEVRKGSEVRELSGEGSEVRKLAGEGSEVRELSGEGSEVRGSEGERSPYVISIVGMGGIGKTTLAKLAYNDAKVQTTLFDKKMWVWVSNPFDVCRVAKEIIKRCGGSTNSIALEELLHEMCELIRGKKLLLVLDNVWTENPNDWKPFELALKYGAQGSRILITTRKKGVAKMVNSAYTINLEVLSNEDIWLICSQMASVDRDDEQLGKLGRELANKCKGLPLAAKILGIVMGGQRSRQKWKNILDSNLWELEDVRIGVLGPFLLSYKELPLAIKRCFLHCASLPKDYRFSRNELVREWMAHRYLGSEESNMEDTGERYFEKLVMHSFFQDFKQDDNDDDKIIRCYMHDVIHDFAQFMSTNEYVTIDGDKELGTDCKSARHLTLELKEETQFPESIYSAKKLRTLFLRTPYFGRMVFPSDLFQHLTCLRSLNWKDSSFEKLPNEVEKLKHLRLLNLSCSNITELPEMMCNLCNLQTLDISGCGQIEKLPQGMGKLIKLRHLLIDECEGLTEPFPKGIGRLSSLRTLNRFIIGGQNNFGECKLGELKNLVHLKGSLGIEGLENVTDVQEAENAQLKNKIHLRNLRLQFGGEAEDDEEEDRRGENDELVLNALEPHPKLESLWIDGYGGTGYPNWLMSLTILKELELESWDNLEQLPPLGKLRFLESLVIEGANSMKKVGVEFLGIESNRKKDEEMASTSTSSLILFPKLKYLDLRFMEEWEEWDGMGESGVSESVLIMPRLQVLTIQECPKLKSLPNFLKKTSVEVLTIDCRISNWMTLACHLPRLKSLRCDNLNSGEHFPTLGKPLFLESLTICDTDSVKKVGFEFLGIEESNKKKKKIDEEKGSTSSSSSLVLFPNLKSLKFVRLKEWEEWDGIGGTMREEEAQDSGVTITIMPRLQELRIQNCPKLKSLPDFLPTTPLKNLDIEYSPILSECCKAVMGDQWPKISHIPNISIYGGTV